MLILEIKGVWRGNDANDKEILKLKMTWMIHGKKKFEEKAKVFWSCKSPKKAKNSNKDWIFISLLGNLQVCAVSHRESFKLHFIISWNLLVLNGNLLLLQVVKVILISTPMFPIIMWITTRDWFLDSPRLRYHNAQLLWYPSTVIYFYNT